MDCDYESPQLENAEHPTVYGEGSVVWIFLAVFITNILYMVLAKSGEGTEWYKSLKKSPWMSIGLSNMWAVAASCTYIVFLSKSHRMLPVFALLLVSYFCWIGWICLFYYGRDIGLSVWAACVLVCFLFWIFVYAWYVEPFYSIFILPILGVNLYIVYITSNVAFLNNVSL